MECNHLLHYQKENTLVHIKKQFGEKLIMNPHSFAADCWILVEGFYVSICARYVWALSYSQCVGGWELNEGNK